MSAAHPTKSPLGSTIKTLLLARGLKAYELGEAIGLSATSVSKIMNGVSRPRQNTFTRMCQELCTTKDEEQRLVSAFAGTELLQEEAAPYGKQRNAEQEVLRMRAEQFLERKTQSIQFKRSVARELDKAGIAYQQDYCQGPYSTDFLIEHNGQRIALECKSNVGRDLEKTQMICQTLKEAFGCEQVVIVVPFSEDESAVNFVAVSELVETLTKC